MLRFKVVRPLPVFDTGIYGQTQVHCIPEIVEETIDALRRFKTNESTIGLRDFKQTWGNRNCQS